MTSVNAPFPVDLSQFKKLSLDYKNPKLSGQQKSDLLHNINIFRDAIVAFTATGMLDSLIIYIDSLLSL